MLHRYRICFADASIPTHSPHAALIGVVDPWTPPPPRRLPPRPHHFFGRFSKLSGTLTGEHHIIKGAFEPLMVFLSNSFPDLPEHHVSTQVRPGSCTCASRP